MSRVSLELVLRKPAKTDLVDEWKDQLECQSTRSVRHEQNADTLPWQRRRLLLHPTRGGRRRRAVCVLLVQQTRSFRCHRRNRE